jgi:hypothetical protein
MAEAKTKPTDVSVDSFLAQVADPARQADCRKLAAMMERATGAPACMWGPSIVGFGRYRHIGESRRLFQASVEEPQAAFGEIDLVVLAVEAVSLAYVNLPVHFLAGGLHRIAHRRAVGHWYPHVV